MMEEVTEERTELFAEFLQDVGRGIDTHTSRMREDIIAMLSFYIRRQLSSIRQSLRQEAERREEALMDEKAKAEALVGVAQESVQKQKTVLQDMVAMLGEAQRRLWCQRRFRSWRDWLARKQQQRRISGNLERFSNTLRAYHIYTQWRLFAAARRQHKITLADQMQWRCRETELLAQVEALKEIVEAERRRSDGLEEKMKMALVRGVCALNKEAVQVLRGTHTAEEERAEAERTETERAQVRAEEAETQAAPSRPHEAQTTRLPSMRTSQTLGSSARFEGHPAQTPTTMAAAAAGHSAGHDVFRHTPHGVPREGHRRAACPVHSFAPPGPPCHVCYAPDTCPYSPRSLSHTPFIVSVDPAAVRSYGDTPASQRPPNIAGKFARPVRPRPAR